MKASDLIKTVQALAGPSRDYDVHIKAASGLEAYETYGQNACDVRMVWVDHDKQRIYLCPNFSELFIE